MEQSIAALLSKIESLEQKVAAIQVIDVDAIVNQVLQRVRSENRTDAISHLVLVRNAKAGYWPRLKEELQQARGYYSNIEEADPPQGFSVPLPQLIAYRRGDGVTVAKGLRQVTDTLTKISRGEFELLTPTPKEEI